MERETPSHVVVASDKNCQTCSTMRLAVSFTLYKQGAKSLTRKARVLTRDIDTQLP